MEPVGDGAARHIQLTCDVRAFCAGPEEAERLLAHCYAVEVHMTTLCYDVWS